MFACEWRISPESDLSEASQWIKRVYRLTKITSQIPKNLADGSSSQHSHLLRSSGVPFKRRGNLASGTDTGGPSLKSTVSASSDTWTFCANTLRSSIAKVVLPFLQQHLHSSANPLGCFLRKALQVGDHFSGSVRNSSWVIWWMGA